ncbi:hypothetical protein FACS1894137_15560 [Spirochaetia bacterium]|nr:hypothetical protein FACS1894137_15560 [Spirochaetia bacterium]
MEPPRYVLDSNIIINHLNKVNLLPTIKEISAAIRRVTKMGLPDAVIAATSIVLSATLLSNDDHLLKLVWPGYTVQAI